MRSVRQLEPLFDDGTRFSRRRCFSAGRSKLAALRFRSSKLTRSVCDVRPAFLFFEPQGLGRLLPGRIPGKGPADCPMEDVGYTGSWILVVGPEEVFRPQARCSDTC